MAKSAKNAKKSAKKTTKQPASAGNVTRIKASDDLAAPKKSSKSRASKLVHRLTAREKADAVTVKELSKPSNKPTQSEINAQKAEKQQPSRFRRNPFGAMIGYFKGAWYELRQVRWPDRINTIKMTIALLIFTAFIGTIIVLLDYLFQYLFELMIG